MMAGRPNRLTPALQEKICQFLRAGNYFSVSCLCSGVSPQVGAEWLSRGRGTSKKRAQTDLYAAFAEAIAKAEAEAEAAAIMRIQKAARGGAEVKTEVIKKPDGTETVRTTLQEPQWTADAWFLERKFHQQWARRDRTEVTGKDGGPLTVQFLDSILNDSDEGKEAQDPRDVGRPDKVRPQVASV